MIADEQPQFTATTADVTAYIKDGELTLMLVDPTGMNAEQGCNLRGSEDEIARPVTCAVVLNRRESVFRHRSPFFISPYFRPELGLSSGLCSFHSHT